MEINEESILDETFSEDSALKEIKELVEQGMVKKALKKWCILYKIKEATFKKVKQPWLSASEELYKKSHDANIDLELGITLLKGLKSPAKEKIEDYAKPLLYFCFNRYNELISQPNELSKVQEDFLNAEKAYNQAECDAGLANTNELIKKEYENSIHYRGDNERTPYEEDLKSNGVKLKGFLGSILTLREGENEKIVTKNKNEFYQVKKNLKEFATLFNENTVLPSHIKARTVEKPTAKTSSF